MTSTAPITVYRTRYCPFCVETERFLTKAGIQFEEIFLDDHPDRRGFTASIMPGHGTVPLIVMGDEPLGGYRELLDLHGSGELARRLASRQGSDPGSTE